MPEPVWEMDSPLPIPAHLIGEVRSKLAYVDEHIRKAEIDPDGQVILLTLDELPGAMELMQIASKVERVVVSMAQGAVNPRTQVLEDHLDRPTPFGEDPFPLLEAQGEVHTEHPGVFTLGPLLSRLIAFFEQQFEALAASFDAAPYRFPTLIPARYLAKVNYFRAFPHSLTFATHLREDLDVIDHFAAHAGCDDHGHLTAPADSFSPVQMLLSPAVCYHLYFALAGQTLAQGVAATAVGQCFRYESTNLTSLERLWNFTMREVIFVGSKDYVLENRELGRQRMIPFFEEIGLAYRVESANDPFFIGEFRRQAAFQSAFQLKFEIRAALPYRNGTLAAGSYNYHQDFFGRHLEITLPDGSPAHTGCVAFGLERMAFAYIAQHGLDVTKWPEPVRRYMQAG